MRKRSALLVALPLIIFSSMGIVTLLGAKEGEPSAPLAPPGKESRATAPLHPASEGAASRPASVLETGVFPDRIYRSGAPTVYRVSRESGVLASMDGGKTWEARNQGLPYRSVYPFDRTLPPTITSFCVDPLNDVRIALTLPETVYISENGGQSWEKIELKEPVKPNDQLTSIALNPKDAAVLLVGTSFHGFFETPDRGKKWIDLSKKAGLEGFGDGSFEEVSSVAYYPPDPSLVYYGLGFGKGLYSFRKEAKSSTRINFPGDQTSAPILDIRFRGPIEGLEARTSGGEWELEARTSKARWLLTPEAGHAPGAGRNADMVSASTDGRGPGWRIDELFGGEEPMDRGRAERRARASNKFGLYVSSQHAHGKLLDSYIEFAKANGLNSMVVDFKDDFGFVAYDTKLEMPGRIGARSRKFTTEELVGKAHANGLYLIGRIVVFRDKYMYNADGFKYAAWDRVQDAPWRYVKKTPDPETGEEILSQSEHWVDPYCEEVWKYNVEIAREMQERGVDEIQFDYIRFPSDGALSRIFYRYRREGMGKIEALESFLAMARGALQIPISTDVYGSCAWARISNWVAQNIETFSRYVDVISPMFYPSHFPREFLGSMQYIPRAGYIYREGADRASWIVEDRCIIRPYVQAFRLGGELNFSQAVYTDYLMSQIQGSLQGASSGFTLWNASNDYYMLTVPLGPYLTGTAVSLREAGQGELPAKAGE